MKKVFVSGDRGFIMGYVIPLLLKNNIEVWGIDNDWKYGPVEKSFDNHPLYHHIQGDAKDYELQNNILIENNIDVFLLGAALIGGISFFHSIPYKLLNENEQIAAASFDAAINAYKTSNLQKIVVMSSSMVFESVTQWPSKEGDQLSFPPPISSYGFQKLAMEYWASAAFKEHGLPYTIVRPFNAVGIGEYRAKLDKEVMSGNIKLAMSHVIPDLIQKIIKGQYPLRIFGNGDQIRHYTYAGDIAEGIYQCILYNDKDNNDFNISTNQGHSVLELAKIIWSRLKTEPFEYISDVPFEYDVQKRIPNTEKAKNILNFTANISLEKALDEVIPWVNDMVHLGKI